MTAKPDEIKALHYRGKTFVAYLKGEIVQLEHLESNRCITLDFVSKHIFVPGISEQHLKRRLDDFVEELQERLPKAIDEAKQSFRVLMALNESDELKKEPEDASN